MRKAFFFMLDAFTALYIMLISISLLLFLVNSPKSLHKQYDQIYDIDRDSLTTLNSLKISEIDPKLRSFVAPDLRDSDNSVLEQIAKNAVTPFQLGSAKALARNYLDSGDSPIIPPNYNYELSVFDIKSNAWIPVAGRDNGKTGTLQAVDYRIVQGYSIYIDPGTNPFGYRACSGSATPCSSPISQFNTGSLIGPTLVRLTVWV